MLSKWTPQAEVCLHSSLVADALVGCPLKGLAPTRIPDYLFCIKFKCVQVQFQVSQVACNSSCPPRVPERRACEAFGLGGNREAVY